jgi:hypothetical protein
MNLCGCWFLLLDAPTPVPSSLMHMCELWVTLHTWECRYLVKLNWYNLTDIRFVFFLCIWVCIVHVEIDLPSQIWYLFGLIVCFPFFFISLISVVLYVCPLFSMLLKYPELQLLLHIAWMWYVYLVCQACLVCPTYLSRQSKHQNW